MCATVSAVKTDDTPCSPPRYHSLVNKYGKLEPLAEIDLRPHCRAQVEVHCEEKVEQVSVAFNNLLFWRILE